MSWHQGKLLSLLHTLLMYIFNFINLFFHVYMFTFFFGVPGSLECDTRMDYSKAD